MCVQVRREYPADSVDPERAARFASAALLKILQPSDWQISSDVELAVVHYVEALRDSGTTGTAFVEVGVHSGHVKVVIGSDDSNWVDERVKLRPRRPFAVTFDCDFPTPGNGRPARPALWPALERPRVEATQREWRDTWTALHEVTQSIRLAGQDLTATLDAIAAGVVRATVFTAAAVNLVQPDGDFKVVAVHGPQDLVDTLLGGVESAASWQAMTDTAVTWGSLRFLRDDVRMATVPEMISWAASTEAGATPDTWNSLDMLFAPLYALDGSMLGVLSVDEPADARNPGVSDLERLEVFADHASAAIERARAALTQ